MTKRQGETSYKETAFGIIPRSKLILLEIEGVKKAWDFYYSRAQKKENSYYFSIYQETSSFD